jgi:hypothetical protein
LPQSLEGTIYYFFRKLISHNSPLSFGEGQGVRPSRRGRKILYSAVGHKVSKAQFYILQIKIISLLSPLSPGEGLGVRLSRRGRKFIYQQFATKISMV